MLFFTAWQNVNYRKGKDVSFSSLRSTTPTVLFFVVTLVATR